eukprot:5735782-Pleurochrysis_carterae.AAC.1
MAICNTRALSVVAALAAPRASCSPASAAPCLFLCARGGVCSSSLSAPAAPAYSRYTWTVSAPSRKPTWRSNAATAALGRA